MKNKEVAFDYIQDLEMQMKSEDEKLLILR